MSQQQLADAAGINVRQINRYEAGDNDPSFAVAVQVAEALNLSLAQPAGQVSTGLDLHGEWWACWQSFRNGEEVLATHRPSSAGAEQAKAPSAPRARCTVPFTPKANTPSAAGSDSPTTATSKPATQSWPGPKTF